METIAVIGSNMVDLVTYVARMPPGANARSTELRPAAAARGEPRRGRPPRRARRDGLKVGDDVFADNTIRNFAREGIDTTHVRKVAGVPSGVAPIFVEPDSSNSILIVKGANRHRRRPTSTRPRRSSPHAR